MTRAILILHRYLGVLTGILMTVWCLSGIVMIYVDFPSVSRAEQLKGSPLVNLQGCCRFGGADLADSETVDGARITMMGGAPVLRVSGEDGRTRAINLIDGHALGPSGPAAARAAAAQFAKESGVEGQAQAPVLIERDQWTVNMGGPNWRVPFNDKAGTVIHVSQLTGEVAQMTDRPERFWNWLGAVPHWLYPTILRENGLLWTKIVIWTSVIGCFLTVTGLWIGIVRFRPRKTAKDETRWSPYAGVNYWHHITGLVFGLLTLTFVFSGLASMNPWGLWAGGAEPVNYLLEGKLITWGETKRLIAAMPRFDLPPGTRELAGAPFDGKPYLTARTVNRAVRFDAEGEAPPPGVMQLSALLSSREGPGLASLIELRREDAYYYGTRAPVTLPVWRAVMRDEDQTRVYIDYVSGQVVGQTSADGRAFRWWHQGLHRLDFTAGIRRRPFWDVLILFAMAGVTVVCALGAWMGIQRIGIDWNRLRRR